jgi:hypothetical protein
MDIEREAEGFAHAGFFKGGADKNGFAGTRKDESKETFAKSPANASEIVQRRTGPDDEGVKGGLYFGHTMLGAEKAIVKIVGREGMNAIAERFEIGEVGRELWGSGRGNGWCQGGRASGGSGVEKMAARDGSHDKEGWCGKGVVSRREEKKCKSKKGEKV